MSKLISLINLFWKWTNLPENQWWEFDIAQLPVAPVEFPLLGDICNACIEIIDKPDLCSNINFFLMGMAIDDEDEDILDYCLKHASEEFLLNLIKTGISFSQPSTRWQLSELLRRNIPQRNMYLKLLSLDPNAYVRTRARNVIQDITNA